MTFSARSFRKAILFFLAGATFIFSMTAVAVTAEAETPRVVDAELSKDAGQISFWVKPDWNGNDDRRHVLLCAGDPEINGMLVEKSAQNMLRFVMAGDSKVSATRYPELNRRVNRIEQLQVERTARAAGLWRFD